MKKLFALSLCMLMIAMLFVGCATQEVEKRYTKMMALEPIIDSSEPYNMRVNTFSVELIDILNRGEWSEKNVATADMISNFSLMIRSSFIILPRTW
jgi:uncharacterized lipoprotein YmbA